MGTSYHHLTAAERTTLMVMQAGGLSLRAIAAHLDRSPSTLSRELERNRQLVAPGDTPLPYDAVLADRRARVLLQAPGRHPKLGPDTALFAVVQDQLRQGLSPEQVAGMLRRGFPDNSARTVAHETIDTALYVMPRHGEAMLRMGANSGVS